MGAFALRIAFAPSIPLQFTNQCQVKQSNAPHRRTPARRSSTISLSTTPITPAVVREYERYLRDVAKAPPPPYLDGLLHVLTSIYKETPAQPADRNGVHPFFIPLTSKTLDTGTRTQTGLLRWPTPPDDMPLPVVRSRGDDLGLTLLAPSSKSLITRAIASADCSGRTVEVGGIRQSTSLALTYQDGEADATGGLERFLVLTAGPFQDIYEDLVRFHRAKGDEQSALVTCERAATAFPGWGRAHAFHAGVLNEMGRENEARDAARFALQMPLWTMGGQEKVEEMRVLAGYVEKESLPKIYRRLYEDKREKEIAEGKLPGQVALDRAAYLLDLCVAEEGDWESTKMQLAELYQEAGMNDFATFVRY